MSASNCVLDLMYPAMESVPIEYKNSIFGRRFGVLLFDVNSSLSARYLSNTELLRCYSVSDTSTYSFLDIPTYISQLDDLLPFCTSVNLRAYITSQLVTAAGFADNKLYSASESVDAYQCYQLTSSPSSMDWTSAYNKDASTEVIVHVYQLHQSLLGILIFSSKSNHNFTNILKRVVSGCCTTNS